MPGGPVFFTGAVVANPDFYSEYGVETGDVITHLNGKAINSRKRLLALARARRPYTIQVSRPGVGYFEVEVE
jgi:hypothetical protein